jgi:hypothetical protein
MQMKKPFPLIVIGEVDPMLHDIGQNLVRQIRRTMADTVDTCDRAELDRLEVVKMVMGVCLTELLRATHALGMSEEEFLGMCRASFQGWQEAEDEEIDPVHP